MQHPQGKLLTHQQKNNRPPSVSLLCGPDKLSVLLVGGEEVMVYGRCVRESILPTDVCRNAYNQHIRARVQIPPHLTRERISPTNRCIRECISPMGEHILPTNSYRYVYHEHMHVGMHHTSKQMCVGMHIANRCVREHILPTHACRNAYCQQMLMGMLLMNRCVRERITPTNRCVQECILPTDACWNASHHEDYKEL